MACPRPLPWQRITLATTITPAAGSVAARIVRIPLQPAYQLPAPPPTPTADTTTRF